MKICFPTSIKRIGKRSEQRVTVTSLNAGIVGQILQGDSRRIAFVFTSISSSGGRIATEPMSSMFTQGIPIDLMPLNFFAIKNIGNCVSEQWYGGNSGLNITFTILEFLEY